MQTINTKIPASVLDNRRVRVGGTMKPVAVADTGRIRIGGTMKRFVAR